MFLPISSENKYQEQPIATYGLMAINVLVFVFFFLKGPEAYLEALMEYGAYPDETQPHMLLYWLFTLKFKVFFHGFFSIFSAAFIHGGFLHLAGNLLFLHIFGPNVESRLGRTRFLGFYLGWTLFSGISYALCHPGSDIPCVGASGAISGVMGAFMVFFPGCPVRYIYFLLLRFGTFELPAVFAIILWIVEQVGMLFLLETSGHSSVAFSAHAGGAVVGVLSAIIFVKNNPVSNEEKIRFYKSIKKEVQDMPYEQKFAKTLAKSKASQSAGRVAAKSGTLFVSSPAPLSEPELSPLTPPDPLKLDRPLSPLPMKNSPEALPPIQAHSPSPSPPPHHPPSLSPPVPPLPPPSLDSQAAARLGFVDEADGEALSLHESSEDIKKDDLYYRGRALIEEKKYQEGSNLLVKYLRKNSRRQNAAHALYLLITLRVSIMKDRQLAKTYFNRLKSNFPDSMYTISAADLMKNL